MPSVFVTGLDGLFEAPIGVPTNGVTEWTMTKDTVAVKFAHYASPVDADGNVYKNLLRGLSEAKVTGKGWIDVNPGTATDASGGSAPGLSNGLFVTANFVLYKGGPWGFFNIPFFIESFVITPAPIDSDKPSTFTFSGFVNGSPGRSSTGTI